MLSDRDRVYLVAVGARVRLLRMVRRLSQDGFAELAGVSRVTLGAIERGEHSAGLLTYVRLAAALHPAVPACRRRRRERRPSTARQLVRLTAGGASRALPRSAARRRTPAERLE